MHHGPHEQVRPSSRQPPPRSRCLRRPPRPRSGDGGKCGPGHCLGGVARRPCQRLRLPGPAPPPFRQARRRRRQPFRPTPGPALPQVSPRPQPRARSIARRALLRWYCSISVPPEARCRDRASAALATARALRSRAPIRAETSASFPHAARAEPVTAARRGAQGGGGAAGGGAAGGVRGVVGGGHRGPRGAVWAR